MILLQAGGDIFRSANPSTSMLYYFGFALLGRRVSLILIGAMLSRRRRPRTDAEIQQYSSGVFRRAAKAMGLPAAAHRHAGEPRAGVQGEAPLAGLFQRRAPGRHAEEGPALPGERAGAVRGGAGEPQGDHLPDQADHRAQRAQGGAPPTPPTFLRPGQVLAVTPEGGGAFSSRVVSNMKDFLTVSVPTQPAGADTRWMRGTKLVRVPVAGERRRLFIHFEGPGL